MLYYGLYTKDPVGWYSMLYTDENGPLVLRPEYRGMACSNCEKIDEEAAVARQIPSDLRITSKRDSRRDVIRTLDDFLLVSQRFVGVMRHEGISGARLLPMPGEERFMLFIPERVPGRFELSGLEANFPVDLHAFAQALVAARRAQQESSPAKCGTAVPEALNGGQAIPKRPEPGLQGTSDLRCVACGRHFATYGSIKSASVTLPTDPLRFFTPSFNHESRRGNRFAVFCSEVVARLLLKHNLTGFKLYSTDSQEELRKSGRS